MRDRPTGLITHSERRLLQGLYTSGPSAYGSIKSLKDASGLSTTKVQHFLHNSNAYTKFHIAKRKFKRLQVTPTGINEIWCADLAFVDKLAKYNGGVKYLLVVIDVLSRFVRVQPMKNKYATTTQDVFSKMLNQVKPKLLWTDQGTEFEGSFLRFCISKDIKKYHTFSETKAAYAERAIRSLKNIMYRFMEEKKTNHYIGQLQSFVKIMNGRMHRSIGMAPKDVKQSDVVNIIQQTRPRKITKPKYKIGNYVRISKVDIPFRKGYKPQFTNEIFKIVKVVTFNPVTYTLEDKDKLVIRGKFYEPELILYTI